MILLAALLGLVGTAPVAAPAESADVEAARQRADQAAGDYVLAREQAEHTRQEADVATLKLADIERRFAEARDAMTDLAIGRYVSSGAQLELFYGQEAEDQAKAEAFSRVVSRTRSDELDRFRAVRAELEAARAELQELRVSADQLEAEAQARASELAAELEIVRAADAERRAAEEAARLAAEADRQAAAAREELNAVAAARAAQEVAAAPAEVASPARPEPEVRGGGDWVCPVAGPSSFFDSWGDPRSGGRSHRGIDMFADYWVPVVAVESGYVAENSGGAGGIGQYLNGSSGTSYYYAHLAGIEVQGQVYQGQVIGYVGDTGNASGGPPHLHFEIHPGGWGTASNPYPSVASYC
ncbi:MAG: peptidoglycan DD-metalloendopeptidase family protein [Acidimicrobiia bacterium]|nr:peptidoglycan DD-metalloendopeptidase family protein [Acidimicrobiia bacterium]